MIKNVTTRTALVEWAVKTNFLENLRLYGRCEAVVIFAPVVECGVNHDQECDNKNCFGRMGCKDTILRKRLTHLDIFLLLITPFITN